MLFVMGVFWVNVVCGSVSVSSSVVDMVWCDVCGVEFGNVNVM